MKLWHVEWKENGRKVHKTTPFLPDGEAAFRWLLGQKPYLIRLIDTLVIRPRERSDPR